MANNGRIQGLTIQIGGDTSKLDKALKSSNQEINNTQKALKDVDKLLKLDPTNIELLTQKQKLLNNEATECSERLKILKEAEKQLKDAGIDENSEQFMGLRREIIDTESKLKDATKQVKNFNAESQALAGAFQEVSDKAGKVAEKTKELSVAGAAVAGAIGTMAYKAMLASDDLNTLAKQSGLTTEEIQRFQYAADVVDVSTDDIISALKKMRKNMDSTSTDVQDAWKRLGVSVRSSNGEFRDSAEVFYATIEALSQVRNETERDILSMELFGKNADSLAGIIDDGGEALKKYADQAKIWSQESIDAANEVNDMIDILKANITQELLIAGAKALEAFKPVIEDIAAAISSLLEFLGSLDSETLGFITTLALIIAAISPVAKLISNITAAISGLMALWPAISGVLAAIVAFVEANPIVLIATAVVALTALIIENWDKIKEVLNNVGDAIAKVVDAIKEKIKDGINVVIGFINGAIDAINKLIDGINTVLSLIGVSFQVPTLNSIPLLANGGTITSGSAIVGEAGAELLSMNNGAATVTPLTNNSTTYNTYNQTSTQPIEVNLQMGSRTLARALVDPLNKVYKLNGGTI